MKKIYQKPTIDVTRIHLETMVATSLNIDSNTSVSTQYTKEDCSEWSDFWDDWDD